MYMTGIHATTHYFGHGAGGRAVEQKAEDDFMERMSQEFREWYEEETGWDIEEAPSHDVTEILWLAWQASRAAVEIELLADKRRMDWLVSKAVNVRDPMVYGSHSMFWSQVITDEEGDYYETKLREQIDAAMDAEAIRAAGLKVKGE